MKTLWTQTRSFSPTAQVLMANQFAINLAFYMLMPYLAAHLSGDLRLAGWAVGLVLGVRNLSQQGMFLLGGALADRYGAKAPIIAGCLLRTAGFALLGFAASVPALVAASIATGFAGALFNPAVRALLAEEAGGRRVEAFAVFNVYYQAGMVAGPVVGLGLLAVDFRAVCAVAAAVFAALTVLQWRALPSSSSTRATEDRSGLAEQWRTVLANRRFLMFAAAMTGCYVLTFQVYLVLPLAVGRALPGATSAATAGLFVLSAAVTVAGQLRLTAWARQRWRTEQAIVIGVAGVGAAFLAPAAGGGPVTRLCALGVAVALLAGGAALAYPFEMDTIVMLAGNRLVATHYGLYNTVCGLGITLGNLAVGALWGWSSRRGWEAVTWLALAGAGCGAALAVGALARTGRLAPTPVAEQVPA